jgi:hypothetical protein
MKVPEGSRLGELKTGKISGPPAKSQLRYKL